MILQKYLPRFDVHTYLPRIAVAVLAVIVFAAVVGLSIAIGFGVDFVVDLVLVVALVWVVWDRANVNYQAELARDDADKAIGRADTAISKADAIERHLIGREPPGGGRHARSASPALIRKDQP